MLRKKDLEVEMGCILKASASVLNSGQGHKEAVRSGLVTKQQMYLILFSSCACSPAQPCFKKDKLKFKDVQAWGEDMEKRPESYSETKAFHCGEKRQQNENGAKGCRVINNVRKINRELVFTVSHLMSNM